MESKDHILFSFRGILVFAFLILSGLISCEKKRPLVQEEVIGITSVDLDANKLFIRSEEAPLGNLITDAFVENALTKGLEVDFAIMGGGEIRFDTDIRPSGIYPAGEITNLDIEEMLPFYNYQMIVELNGTQLLSVFERGAASVGRGAFLQVSKEVNLFIDLNKQPQLIDQTVFPTEIALEGNRVDSVFIHGTKLQPDGIYHVAMSNFIALGGDQNVTLYNLGDEHHKYTEDLETVILEEYIRANTPISPVTEGRITFN